MINRNRNSGFSVIELLIAAAIGSTLVYLLGGFLRNMFEAQERTENAQMALVEENLGNRQVFMDMRRSGVSFNLMRLDDDSSREFFDFLPDVTCNTNCRREYKIEVGNPAKSFPVMMSEGGLASPTPLNPVRFYDATPAPNLSTPGSLNFNLTRLLNNLRNPPDGVNLLQEGRTLLFYSPITMRPIGPLGINMNQPPGFVSLITMVTPSLGLQVVSAPWMPEQRHPAMPAVNIAVGHNGATALDTFFRTMPPVGGEKAFGMVMPITVVRFFVEPITLKGKATGQLVRERFQQGNWTQKVVLARDIESVTFIRKSISIPSIATDMEVNVH